MPHALASAVCVCQVVVMLGHVHAHKLLASDITARGVLMFTVTKVNMGGVEQLRIVCLDDQRHALLNFDKAMRLKKSVPLKHLIQVGGCLGGIVGYASRRVPQ